MNTSFIRRVPIPSCRPFRRTAVTFAPIYSIAVGVRTRASDTVHTRTYDMYVCVYIFICMRPTVHSVSALQRDDGGGDGSGSGSGGGDGGHDAAQKACTTTSSCTDNAHTKRLRGRCYGESCSVWVCVHVCTLAFVYMSVRVRVCARARVNILSVCACMAVCECRYSCIWVQ